MLSLIALSVLLLAVVIFALQNAQAVTVWFVFWQVQSSVAIVALAATAAGVMIAEVFRLARRLLRWKHGRPVNGSAPPAVPTSEPGQSSHRRAESASVDADRQSVGGAQPPAWRERTRRGG